jgi:transcriptional regulator with XRE-family HTH domain
MNALQNLVKEELDVRHISYRKAASEIGIAHTTLIRIVEGYQADVPTVQKIALWLKVSPSSLMDTLETGDGDDVVRAIATIISSEPELAAIFIEAGERFQKGTMSLDEVRELARYAAWRFHIGTEEQSNAVNKTNSNARKRRSVGAG